MTFSRHKVLLGVIVLPHWKCKEKKLPPATAGDTKQSQRLLHPPHHPCPDPSHQAHQPLGQGSYCHRPGHCHWLVHLLQPRPASSKREPVFRGWRSCEDGAPCPYQFIQSSQQTRSNIKHFISFVQRMHRLRDWGKQVDSSYYLQPQPALPLASMGPDKVCTVNPTIMERKNGFPGRWGTAPT